MQYYTPDSISVFLKSPFHHRSIASRSAAPFPAVTQLPFPQGAQGHMQRRSARVCGTRLGGTQPERRARTGGIYAALKFPGAAFCVGSPEGSAPEGQVTSLGSSGTDPRWAGSRTGPHRYFPTAVEGTTYPVLLDRPGAALVTPARARVLLLLSIKFLKSC